MPAVCLSFNVHIPRRLLPDAGNAGDYFDTEATKTLTDLFADACYLPANTILQQAIAGYPGTFAVAFSISGSTLDLLETFRPDVLQSFQQLLQSGGAELLAAPYYNSFSWLYSKKEFKRQVRMHEKRIQELFGVRPGVLRNTDLVHENELAIEAAAMGFKGLICEGLSATLRDRSPNQLYAAPGNGEFGLLLRHAALSDDIAFRFDDPQWTAYPLSAEQFAGWLPAEDTGTELVSLNFDYETFGIHKKKESGIFNFLAELPGAVLQKENWTFLTPGAALEKLYPRDVYDVPQASSWEDTKRNRCAGSELMLQHNALQKIYSIESLVLQSREPGLPETWGRLQSAEHFYYMCPEGRYNHDPYGLNPYTNAEKAGEIFRNIVAGLEVSLIREGLRKIRSNQRREESAALHYSTMY